VEIRCAVGLWVIVAIGLGVFFLPSFISLFLFPQKPIPFEVVLIEPRSDERIQLAKNTFMEGFALNPSFFRNTRFPGFTIESVEETSNPGIIRVSEKKASFMVQLDDGFYRLLDEWGEVLWVLRHDQLIPFLALPILFNTEDSEIPDIVARLNRMPMLFRNYVSSIDVGGMVIYLRGGNQIITRSWESFEHFSYETFIQSMGQRTTYELFSSGRYFIVDRKR
jgi:hypothetical protein